MATHQCDLVMKGGITSGVIYPRLVAKLSEVYRFRSIGGTSAGAIAAGAAAAAQLGVTTGGNPKAFAELDKLPELLGGPAKNANGSMLLNLFQPQPPFRRHFALLTSALNARSRTLTSLAVAWAAVWRFPVGALLGALPGALIAWYSTGLARGLASPLPSSASCWEPPSRRCARSTKHLPDNNFGMCNGMADADSKVDVLSQWLHGYLNSLAGKAGDEPVTFGELWAARLRAPGAPAPHDGTGEKEIELAMITTALNTGRPLRFPFETRDLYFKPEELGNFLPSQVSDWMIAHARDSEVARSLSAEGPGFLALPAPEDMPVLLGVRMSLSFPILLSAIPLYTIDWTRAYNANMATRRCACCFRTAASAATSRCISSTGHCRHDRRLA
jgi:hypothetical protein